MKTIEALRQTLYDALPRRIFREEEPLARHTSFRIGGPAELMAFPTEPAQLQTLPGIGEATARKILEYRELSGGFLTIEQIMEVDGIGEKKYEAMKELITVEDTEP